MLSAKDSIRKTAAVLWGEEDEAPLGIPRHILPLGGSGVYVFPVCMVWEFLSLEINWKYSPGLIMSWGLMAKADTEFL